MLGREEQQILSSQPGTTARDTVGFGTINSEYQLDSIFLELPARISTTVLVQGTTGSRTAAFSPSPSFGIGDGCVVISQGDSGQVHVFSGDGRWLRTFQVPATPRQVRTSDVEDWVAENLKPLPESERSLARRVLREAARPSRLPAVSDVLVDAAGLIWIQEYAPPLGLGGQWLIHELDGSARGRLALPQGVERVFEVGGDYVLGTTTSEIGEPIVQVWGLTRTDDARAAVTCDSGRR